MRHDLALVVTLLAAVSTPHAGLAQDVAGHDHHAPLPEGEELAALPPNGGPKFNRLVFETSPYLRQHARNPVDWFPWGPAALRQAQMQDRPILLSVGYSTCHWCHVMERESFADPQIAALLNQTFVCIKVDREERPDIDAVYMQVTQAMTGRGGWPNTVLMTPAGEPFFAATYLPPRGRYGNTGLVEVCQKVSEAWRLQRDGLEATASQIATALRQDIEQRAPRKLGPEVVEQGVQQLQASSDAELGGFGSAPKFPVPHRLGLLLRHHRRTGNRRSLDIVVQQLDAMRAGGIWDHVGGGFHRYSTDRRWLLPHFEKMLYDQALLAGVLVETYQVTGEERFERTAREVLGYVERELSAPDGGFYSAVDADSEGEEGTFYLWSLDQLEEVLGAEDAELAASWYGCEEAGNFVEEARRKKIGTNVLHTATGLEEFAAARDMEPGALEGRLARIRERLFEAREERVHPFRDDKVLTDWNGLMIGALARAGAALGEPRFVERAERAAAFLRAELRQEDGTLQKLWRSGSSSGTAMLDDHAFLAAGLVDLYSATFDESYLEWALELCELALQQFGQEDSGGLFLSPATASDLILRPKEVYDGALPSGNSVMALTLTRLARLTGRGELEERAAAIVEAFGAEVAASPASHAHLLQALELLTLEDGYELVVAAPDGEHAREALLPFQRAFLPHVALVSRPAGEGAAITALAPFTAEQTARDGAPTAYLCRDHACELPTTDLASVLERLVAEASSGEEPASEER